MLKSNLNILRPSFVGNISFMLLAYWAVLVIWQNISGTAARTTVDMVIKILLLSVFVLFYILNSRTVSKKLIGVLAFSIALLITLFMERSITLNLVVSYVYPILILAMVYGLGDDFKINQRQLIAFCNGIIIIVMYAAVYSLIFCREQFASAFSSSSAYGNELTSFFTSSHEYGMYLVYALASCIICLKFKEKQRLQSRLPYILALIIFIPNIVLTYSRTSMLAAVLLILFYVMFSKDIRVQISVVAILSAIFVVIICVPTLQEFIFVKIFKENNMAGRDVLFELALQLFKDGTIFQQLFGHGIVASRSFLEGATSHGSVHNAYLQILLYYGVVGLTYIVSFIIVQVIACLKLIQKDRFMGAILLGIMVAAATMMFTNTAVLFMSPIDSYFMTMFAVIVPKYVRNAIFDDKFYSKEVRDNERA